jgi:hypothetical protein
MEFSMSFGPVDDPQVFSKVHRSFFGPPTGPLVEIPIEIGAHYGKPTKAKVRLGPPWATTPPVKIVVSSPLYMCPAFKSCAFCSK